MADRIEAFHQKLSSIDDVDMIPARNVIIVYSEKIAIKGHLYLLLVAIDIFSAQVIRVVDTNGAKYGLLYNAQVYSDLKSHMVISAVFSKTSSNYYINTLRIASSYKKIGLGNIFELSKKYRTLFDMSYFIGFDDVERCIRSYSTVDMYCICHFMGTDIRRVFYGKGVIRYQIKMGDRFVSLLDKRYTRVEMVGKHVRGYVLLHVVKKSDDACVYATRLLCIPSNNGIREDGANPDECASEMIPSENDLHDDMELYIDNDKGCIWIDEDTRSYQLVDEGEYEVRNEFDAAIEYYAQEYYEEYAEDYRRECFGEQKDIEGKGYE